MIVRRRQRGAALLLTLVLVMTVGMALMIGRSDTGNRRFVRDQATEVVLAQARAALVGYAVTYRDTHGGEVFGYLPCPDFDGDGKADAFFSGGGCTSAADGKAAVGLLPYMTLGLPDLRDRDGVCLWYAVSGRFKAAIKKPEPLNWDTRGQFEVRDMAGAVLAAPDDSSGGAAAVVFAAGAPLTGQKRTANTAERCQTHPGEIGAYLDGSYNFASSATTVVATGPVIDANGNITNNDTLVWITPREIFDIIRKRGDFGGPAPDGHLNRLISQLADDLAAALPDPVDATTAGSGGTQRLVGVLPVNLAVDADLVKYRDNWRNQFRYVKCSSGLACLNGGTCAGALLFAGERTGGGPRATAEALDIGSFLEGDRLAVWKASTATFTPNETYAAHDAATDVARCIDPSGGGGHGKSG